MVLGEDRADERRQQRAYGLLLLFTTGIQVPVKGGGGEVSEMRPVGWWSSGDGGVERLPERSVHTANTDDTKKQQEEKEYIRFVDCNLKFWFIFSWLVVHGSGDGNGRLASGVDSGGSGFIHHHIWPITGPASPAFVGSRHIVCALRQASGGVQGFRGRWMAESKHFRSTFFLLYLHNNNFSILTTFFLFSFDPLVLRLLSWPLLDVLPLHEWK